MEDRRWKMEGCCLSPEAKSGKAPAYAVPPRRASPPSIFDLPSSTFHLRPSIFDRCSYRAGNGTRTRDPNLGKVVLYQLSYSRDRVKIGTRHDSYKLTTATSDGTNRNERRVRGDLGKSDR